MNLPLGSGDELIENVAGCVGNKDREEVYKNVMSVGRK